jgi:NAD(P)H-flavin reductase
MIGNEVLEKPATALHAMVPAAAKVKQIIWETDDTFTLMLETSALREYAFSPGQFNMLYAFGVGEAAISISSHPGREREILHTIHRVGTVTTALSQVKKGGAVGLRGPFGSSWSLESAHGRDVCIVAGGIGLAPLRPLIYSLLDHREMFGRIILLYGARSPRDLLYTVELEKWQGKNTMEVLSIVDRGDSAWKGHIGVVTNLFSYIRLDERRTVAYVCGPETMMKYTVMELEKRGVASDQIYLSMERNMKCAVGFCGHCQFGPYFICKDGPVFHLPAIKDLLDRKEL